MNPSIREDFLTVRELLQGYGRPGGGPGDPWYEGEDALGRIEEQLKTERQRAAVYLATKDETVRLLRQSEARAQGYKDQLEAAQERIARFERILSQFSDKWHDLLIAPEGSDS